MEADARAAKASSSEISSHHHVVQSFATNQETLMNKTDHTETYRPWQTQGTQNEWLPLSASFSEDGYRKPTPGATWKTR
jgi:hypothetical protein